MARDSEYWQKLKEKLIEEAEEFIEDENIEELADLMEVIDAIMEHKNFKTNEIEEARERKAKERGRFKDKIILDES